MSWRWIQPVLLGVAAGLAILLSPLPAPEHRSRLCVAVEELPRDINIVVNCDSPEFIRLARNPARLLEKNSRRQTRPLYAVLGHVLAKPFKWAGLSSDSEASILNPYYAGYVALNFAVLILVLGVFSRILSTESLLARWTIIPTAVIALNEVIKAFIWTPHQQIFGLLVPMMCIWLTQRLVLNERGLTVRRALIAGVFAGCMSLIYGAFVLVPATFTVAILFYRRESAAKTVPSLLLAWITTMAPFILWREFVIRKTGSFFSLETDHYHEFVWIRETLQQHGFRWFAVQSLDNARMFFETIPTALFLSTAFLVAGWFIASRGGPRVRSVTGDNAFKSAIAFIVVGAAFYLAMGYYAPRLTVVLIVPLAVITATASKSHLSNAAAGSRSFSLETLAAIVYAAVVIILPGPFA